MQAYERVLRARATGRPTALRFIENCFSGFYELHGDRGFADDPAIVGGIAYLGNLPVTVIATEKGADTPEKIRRNFGSAHPEGYRKALRLMRQAEKFRRPVVCLVDTAGAFCGIGAEERGQGHAIATNLMEMSTLKTPILSIVIGEGGSGGALALAVADEVWMLENAVYSVISPEGAASILLKDASRMAEMAESLRLTADDLLALGVIERILPEPENDDFKPLYAQMADQMEKMLRAKLVQPLESLLRARFTRYAAIGGQGFDRDSNR